MAKYEIFGSINLSPSGFFPVDASIEVVTDGNRRDYSFTVDGQARFIRVYWDEQSLIHDIGLYSADNESLAEITGISVDRDQFQNLWLQSATTSTQVFSYLLSSNDELVGNDAENIFAPGLGNDTIFGGNNSPNFSIMSITRPIIVSMASRSISSTATRMTMWERSRAGAAQRRPISCIPSTASMRLPMTIS